MEFTGPLNVDAARGKFNQFVLGDRQVLLPQSFFQLRQYTTAQLYDNSAPPVQVGNELTDEGRALFNKLRALGGKGVTIIGEAYDRMVNFTQDFQRPQACVIATDVIACPKANPPLCPELVELLRQKEERDEAEKLQKRREADETRMENLRDARRQALLIQAMDKELQAEVDEQLREDKKQKAEADKKGKQLQSS